MPFLPPAPVSTLATKTAMLRFGIAFATLIRKCVLNIRIVYVDLLISPWRFGPI